MSFLKQTIILFFPKSFVLQRKLTATRHLLGDAHPVQVEILVNPLLDRRNTVTATALVTTTRMTSQTSLTTPTANTIMLLTMEIEHRLRLPKTQTLTILFSFNFFILFRFLFLQRQKKQQSKKNSLLPVKSFTGK